MTANNVIIGNGSRGAAVLCKGLPETGPVGETPQHYSESSWNSRGPQPATEGRRDHRKQKTDRTTAGKTTTLKKRFVNEAGKKTFVLNFEKLVLPIMD